MDFWKNSIIIEEMNRMNMNILEMTYARLGEDWNGEACRAPYTRVYYIEEGRGEIYCGDKRILLIPGNIYLIPSETEFRYSCDRFLSKLYYHINILRTDNYDLFAEYNECIVLENRKKDIEQAMQLWKKKDIASAMLLKTQLYSIVNDAIMQKDICLGDIEKYSEVINRTMRFIDRNLNCALTAERIAEGVSAATGTLQKWFRQEVGMSLGKYVNECLMFRAEKMLRTQKVTIREISEQLGFCDQFYFTRCFTRRYGVSPTEYRKSMLCYQGHDISK